MPRGDKTGPNGEGSGTGGRRGDCTPEEIKKGKSWKILVKDKRRKKRIGSKDGSGDGRGDGTNSQNGSGRGN